MNVMTAAATWLDRSGGRIRRTTRRRTGVGPLVLAAVALVGLCCALVWVRLQVVRTGYELSTARRVEQRLGKEDRELRIELATLTSPRRLERLARRRLGMRPPEPEQIVNLR